MTDDSYDLQRFVDAQEAAYWRVLEELQRGRKTSHWMWYIFPQIAGLGFSATARRYAISSIDEAKAYLEHPVLGPRLTECINLLLDVHGQPAEQILGGIDALKFRSCLTLFAATETSNTVFEKALQKYYEGIPDEQTLSMIQT